MKKIVIVTDKLEENERIIKSFESLFPECEIQIQPKPGKKARHLKKAPEHPAAYNTGGQHEH